MPKKLLTLLAEEITEQGFGRYFQDAILPSGQRIGDVKSVDLSTGKPIDITISDTESLPNKVEGDEKYVGGSNNEPLKDNDIVDISGQSTYKRKNERLNPRKYFMLHHTAGRGTAQNIVSILNNRRPRLGIQWIIDRNGIIYRGLPDGSRGAHVAYQRINMGHVNNSNTEGVEIIANDDSDVLDLQCKSALKLVKKLGYSLSNIYTHGEVSTNKQKTEGKKCKAYFEKYWRTPFNMIDKNSEEIKNKVEHSKVVGGNSKKQKFIYPLPEKVRLSSQFGLRWGKHHDGVDLACPSNTDVYSIADGKVVRADMTDYGGYGNFIIIRHVLNGETLYSGYAHLNKMLVSVGNDVIQKQKIALSGGSQGKKNGAGNSKKSHLHFEIRKSQTGNHVDPLNYIDNIM